MTAPKQRRTTVAVVGVGAIGATVADELDPERVEVLLCRSRPAGVTVLRWDGVSSVGGRVIVDPESVGPVDWVVLATKAVDDPSVWLDALVEPGTRIAVTQNGIDLPSRVAEWVPADRCVPVVVRISAERLSPDLVAVRYPGPLLTDGSPAARDFASLFRQEGSVRAVPDLEAESWRKLIMNVVVNSLTTLSNRTSADCTGPAMLPLTRALLTESTQVAIAAGVALTEQDEDLALGQIIALPAIHSSMQTDLQQGHPLEHRFITGAMLAHADRLGCSVPTIRAVHALLAAVSPEASRAGGGSDDRTPDPTPAGLRDRASTARGIA